MDLAHIIRQYQPTFQQLYAGRLLPGHQQALSAMLRYVAPVGIAATALAPLLI